MVESKANFEELSTAASPAALAKWREQEAAAMEDRLEDVRAMDIFEVSTDKGAFPVTSQAYTLPNHHSAPSRAANHLRMAQEEAAGGHQRGATTMIAEGIKIEEIQSVP